MGFAFTKLAACEPAPLASGLPHAAAAIAGSSFLAELARQEKDDSVTFHWNSFADLKAAHEALMPRKCWSLQACSPRHLRYRLQSKTIGIPLGALHLILG